MPADTAARRVSVRWIGEGPADASLLEGVRAHVAAQFDASVDVCDPGDRPAGTLDPRRGQHASRLVLAWLVERAPRLPDRLLGLTDVDLFMPVLTFVFGEAQLEGATALVSTARLRAPGDPRLTLARVGCEAVHELGHTYGLLHCDGFEGTGRRARRCAMTRSASVRAVDEKSGRLCPDCRARIAALAQDGSHVYREHHNPHR